LLVFGCFVAFVAVWTLYGAIAGAPKAIHGDMSEAYVWGREFQLGYNQHPPFWAWIAGAWFSVAPKTGWSFALLSSLNAALGVLGAWFLIGDFTSANRRLAATALLLLTPFFTFLSFKYNANSIFLSLWPWTTHFFVRSIDERRLGDAVWFGVFMAAAMLSKYYAIILALSCLLAACLHPERKRYFTSPAPYISLLVGLALFSPHVWWLFHSDFRSVRYALHLSATHEIIARGWAGPARYALDLLAASIAYHLIVLGLILGVARTTPRSWLAASRRLWPDRRFRFLLALALAPLIFTALAGLALHLKISSNMTIGIFSLAPLILIELIGVRDEERLRRRSVQIAVALSLGALLVSPAVAYMTIRFDNKDPAVVLPQVELAREATLLWRQRIGLPLSYVAGGRLYPGAISFYSPDHPHGFVGFDFGRAPWVTPADLARAGLLAVCQSDDQPCQASATAFSTPQTIRMTLTLRHTFWGYSRPPRAFILYLIPPRTQPPT